MKSETPELNSAAATLALMGFVPYRWGEAGNWGVGVWSPSLKFDVFRRKDKSIDWYFFDPTNEGGDHREMIYQYTPASWAQIPNILLEKFLQKVLDETNSTS